MFSASVEGRATLASEPSAHAGDLQLQVGRAPVISIPSPLLANHWPTRSPLHSYLVGLRPGRHTATRSSKLSLLSRFSGYLIAAIDGL